MSALVISKNTFAISYSDTVDLVNLFEIIWILVNKLINY